MADFITVFENKEERMINLEWVEEIRPDGDGKAVIYFAFQGVGCIEQDCIKTDESYNEVKRKIWRYTMANEKLISAISAIERALGMIEGVSYGLCDSQACALVDAIEKIDGALEVLKDGK